MELGIDVLENWKQNKINEIKIEMNNKLNELKKDDDITKLYNEFSQKINEKLGRTEKNKFKIHFLEMYTDETYEKINNVKEEYETKNDKIIDKYLMIRAMLKNAQNYNDVKDIFKEFQIYDEIISI